MTFRLLMVVVIGLGVASSGASAASPQMIKEAIIKLFGGGAKSAPKHADEVPLAKPPSNEQGASSGAIPSPVPPAGRSASRLGDCPHANSSKIKMDQYIEVTASKLNFRKCAAENCSVLGSLKRGSYKVDVLAINNCWLEVGVTTRNGDTVYGFLSGDYVKFR